MDMNKYLGILRWSLNYTDGTKESSVEAMSPERKAWLREALESQTVDPAEQMKNIVKILEIPRSSSDGTKGDTQEQPEDGYVERKVQALKALQEWVEQIDWAADLHKIGGLKTVISLTKDEEESIRSHAFEVLATVVQNNPGPQEWALELNALDGIVENFNRENLSHTEVAKTILALSSLIRDCTKATVAFIKEHKGVALLMKIIGDDRFGTKAQRKALFLMRYVLDTVPAIRIVLAELLVRNLSTSMLSKDVDLRENSLHILISMFEDANVTERVPEELRNEMLVNLDKFQEDFAQEIDQVSRDLAKQLRKVALEPPILRASTSEDAPKLLGN